MLVSKLEALPPVEGHPFPRGEPYSEKPDIKVVGLLSLIRSLIPLTSTLDVSALEAVANCVLKLNDCKCERQSSRHCAFETLLEFCDAFPETADDYIARRLKTCFGEKFLVPLQDWNVDPCSDMRSPLGLAGLVNLGCTCYINSLVQQLWNIPQIRIGFKRLKFSTPPPPPPASSSGASHLAVVYPPPPPPPPRGSVNGRGLSFDKKKEDDLQLLILLQTCMSHLSFTTKRAYTLERFVRSFKDEFGNPTNVLEQQDAQEFF
jgi:hypothetical protein